VRSPASLATAVFGAFAPNSSFEWVYSAWASRRGRPTLAVEAVGVVAGGHEERGGGVVAAAADCACLLALARRSDQTAAIADDLRSLESADADECGCSALRLTESSRWPLQ